MVLRELCHLFTEKMMSNGPDPQALFQGKPKEDPQVLLSSLVLSAGGGVAFDGICDIEPICRSLGQRTDSTFVFVEPLGPARRARPPLLPASSDTMPESSAFLGK